MQQKDLGPSACSKHKYSSNCSLEALLCLTWSKVSPSRPGLGIQRFAPYRLSLNVDLSWPCWPRSTSPVSSRCRACRPSSESQSKSPRPSAAVPRSRDEQTAPSKEYLQIHSNSLITPVGSNLEFGIPAFVLRGLMSCIFCRRHWAHCQPSCFAQAIWNSRLRVHLWRLPRPRPGRSQPGKMFGPTLSSKFFDDWFWLYLPSTSNRWGTVAGRWYGEFATQTEDKHRQEKL